ncbi:UDP-glucose 4-epimerase GalE [Anaerococcus sp.]|uniref:UDP-glucose 4-epimerase GalE n=1 Tax=Anaerococcus sp. TaxID=1872515 RepID=UPI0025865E91|nr:UDP-glucose 4-epimerase GalE [Anaerococcus sp.]MDU2566557.1 UDP-glucose 4-epimerase GalE [Anaerococcus sp.]MDU3210848.1 UDP-glucose 4-epimerase GalE [Anaerococcus sp.]
MKKLLLTGGAGYIGSHTAVELLDSGYEVVIYDNLLNSSKVAIDRVEEITGKNVTFYEADILDTEFLREVLEKENIYAVIHFAALKSVSESVNKPLKYYHNNLTGTLSLLTAMQEAKVKKIIFSSSATVYGTPEIIPITEKCPKGVCTNPYGWSKSFMEQIMTDLNTADPEFKVVLLRYFNPIGAHKSGLIGEDPKGIPNNLLPYVSKVAAGELGYVHVFGDDYNTCDGTGVRDYIHVVDLARGHLKALEKIDDLNGVEIINLATGNGYSVLEVIRAFEKASGKEIPYKIEKRRPGDIDKSYADASKAKEIIDWQAEYGIDQMCEDAWRWQKNNPKGYEGR